jgi:hypothetical protein
MLWPCNNGMLMTQWGQVQSGLSKDENFLSQFHGEKRGGG